MTDTGSVDHPARKRKQAACSAALFRNALVSALALALPPAYAADQQESPDGFDFVLSARVLYDDNLFRLSDSESPAPFLGESQKSDLIYSASAGIRIDKPYAQQRFQLDAVVVDNRYQTYDFLNHTAFNYRGAWLWHLTPRISGVLLAEQRQELNNFADFPSITQKSIQTNQAHVFTVDGDIGAGVHLLAGLVDVRSRNSEAFEAVGDYRQGGAELGIKYVSRAQNWISLVQRETAGEYRGRVLDPVAQLDTGFDESMTEATLNWRASEKSEFQGRLGYVDRTHDNFSQRDYSGMVGRLLYRWQPTDKLRLDTSLSRNLFSFQEDANSYYVADTFSISPIWKYSPKTTLRLRYDYGNHDYRSAIVPTAEMRKDTVQSLLFAADWQATRKLTITGTLQHTRRDSNLDDYGYNSNFAGVNVEFLF